MILSRQLRALGYGQKVVERLCGQGLLVPVRRGAFILGRSAPSEWQRAVAAVLSAGPTAVLSHATASRIHGLEEIAVQGGVELTVPASRHPRLRDVTVHRAAVLPADHVQLLRGVRVTTPARTLVDIAGRLPADGLAKLFDEGCIARRWTPESVASALEQVGSRQGAPLLRSILQLRLEQPAADSVLEVRAARALRCFMPFEVHFQLVLGGQVLVLDLAWPAFLVAAECDGWDVRSRSRGKFDRDRRRDNLLAAHGWSVAHLTSAMSDDEMRAAVARLLLRRG